MHFKNIHLPTKNSGSYENENMIFIKMSNGGIIEGLINGNIKLAYCKAFTIRNCHLELGIIDIDRSSVTMIDNYLRSKPGKNTIYLAGTEGNTDATMHQQ